MSKILSTTICLLLFCTSFSQDLIKFEEKDYFGFRKKTGEVIIPAIYGFADEFKDGYAIVAKDISRPNQVIQLSIIDKNGKKIIEKTYEKIQNLGYGLFAIGVEDFGNIEYGIINSKGEIILDIKFSNDFKVSDSLIVYSKNRIGYGVINFSGDEIVPIQSEFIIREFKNEIAIVVVNHSNHGLINKKGEFILNPKNSNLSFSSEFNKFGIATIKRNNKYGLINSLGKIIVEPIYSMPTGLSDNGITFEGKIMFDGKGHKK